MPRYYPTKRDERCPCGVTGPEPAGRIRPKVPATATRGQHHPTLESAPGQPDTALAHRPGHKHRVWPGAGMGEALPSSGALRLHMESCGHLPRGGCVLLQPGPAARPPGMRGCTGMNRNAQGCTGNAQGCTGTHTGCTGNAQGVHRGWKHCMVPSRRWGLTMLFWAVGDHLLKPWNTNSGNADLLLHRTVPNTPLTYPCPPWFPETVTST